MGWGRVGVVFGGFSGDKCLMGVERCPGVGGLRLPGKEAARSLCSRAELLIIGAGNISLALINISHRQPEGAVETSSPCTLEAQLFCSWIA